MRCEDYIDILREIRSGNTVADFSSVTSDHIRAGLAVATARENTLMSGLTT